MKLGMFVGSSIVCGALALGAAAQTSDSASSGKNSQAQPASTRVAAGDKLFVKKAADGGMAEVELGKLAADKASSDEVKKFGQRMVDDIPGLMIS